MIPYKAFPYIDLGFFKIYTFGLMVAIGVIIAALLSAKRAKKKGLDPEKIYSLIFWVLIGGLIVSRISYVLLDMEYFLKTPLQILKIWDGGLTFYGGFIGAIIAAIIYAKITKINFLRYVNIVAVYVPLAHVFGRLGCFLTADDYGIASNLPWAMNFGDGVLRHPTQIYLMLTNFITFLTLRKIKKNIFLWYILIYSGIRFFMEFIRYYPQQIYFLGLTTGQLISVIAFVVSGIWLFKKHRKI